MRLSVLATTLVAGAFLVWMVSFTTDRSIYGDGGRAPHPASAVHAAR
jgi:hypothetical protein